MVSATVSEVLQAKVDEIVGLVFGDFDEQGFKNWLNFGFEVKVIFVKIHLIFIINYLLFILNSLF